MIWLIWSKMGWSTSCENIITAEDHIDVVVVFQGSSICIALRCTYAKGNATFNDITDHQLICIHLRKRSMQNIPYIKSIYLNVIWR